MIMGIVGKTLNIRNHNFVFGKQTFIIGIVNVTPDSFSKDGITDTQQAVALALKQIEQGAQIIDIGGQSTRPGYEPIDEQTELKRIIPVIKELRKQSDVIISVDTFSAKVAVETLNSGADILNSIWGLTEELLPVIQSKKIPIIIMHNKSEAVYPNGIVKEVKEYFSQAAEKALKAGLIKEQIILDPGIGFGKTADHNIELMSCLKEIVALGFPTLIGTSRKSTIGKLIDKDVDERVFGTAATIAFAIAHGVDIVRVHDVAEIADVVKVSDALVRNWRPNDWDNTLKK